MVRFIVLNHESSYPDEQADCLHEAGEIVPPHIHTPLEDANKYSQILRSKAIPLLALFLLLYVGVTLTIGGTCRLLSYVTTYLLF